LIAYRKSSYHLIEEVLKVVKGQIVKALLFGGGEAPRRVVADKGDVIVLCSEAEYQFAITAKREPNGVGFPRVDVVETSQPARRKSVSSESHEEFERSKAGD
jgi:hypothetical protein